MSENPTEDTVRVRRVSGVRSARVSQCSSSGNPSSCRNSIISFERSLSASHLDEVTDPNENSRPFALVLSIERRMRKVGLTVKVILKSLV